MKKLATFIIAILFASSSLFANGLSLNSPGPVGLGMGGAYVGLANDLTTIYWNPAGITNVNTPELSVYYTGLMPSSSYKYEFASAGIDVDTESESAMYHIPGFFTAWPCMFMEDLYIGLGVYVPAGLGSSWNGDDFTTLSNDRSTSYEWMSQIGAVDITPTFAYKFNDMLSLGVGFTIRYGMFDLKRPMDMLEFNTNPPNPTPGKDGMLDTQYEENSTGLGYGVNVGLLIKPIEDLSIGLSYKTETTVAFEGTAFNATQKMFTELVGGEYKDADLKRDLAWPMWFGGGIAYNFTDEFTLAFDVQYSQWSATEDEVETTYEGWIDPNTGEDTKSIMNLHWDDAMQIRVGAQYKVCEKITARVGYYYDPAPAPNSTLNILFPSHTYQAPTFGVTYMMDNFGIDFGAEYLIGDEREVKLDEMTDDNMVGIHKTNIFAFALGFKYIFGEMK